MLLFPVGVGVAFGVPVGVAEAFGVAEAVGVDEAFGEAVGVAVAPPSVTSATAVEIGNSVAIATKAAASREDLPRTVLQSWISRSAR
ncbi:hypothetical protein ACTMTI_39865 [Nonomuraea sp. H19]|uniref:hypothetical protein n=1 Tax=Nonomuraea sp. H19 TaxID=3452206 RepID=UPI003F891BDB